MSNASNGNVTEYRVTEQDDRPHIQPSLQRRSWSTTHSFGTVDHDFHPGRNPRTVTPAGTKFPTVSQAVARVLEGRVQKPML